MKKNTIDVNEGSKILVLEEFISYNNGIPNMIKSDVDISISSDYTGLAKSSALMDSSYPNSTNQDIFNSPLNQFSIGSTNADFMNCLNTQLYFKDNFKTEEEPIKSSESMAIEDSKNLAKAIPKRPMTRLQSKLDTEKKDDPHTPSSISGLSHKISKETTSTTSKSNKKKQNGESDAKKFYSQIFKIQEYSLYSLEMSENRDEEMISHLKTFSQKNHHILEYIEDKEIRRELSKSDNYPTQSKLGRSLIYDSKANSSIKSRSLTKLIEFLGDWKRFERAIINVEKKKWEKKTQSENQKKALISRLNFYYQTIDYWIDIFSGNDNVKKVGFFVEQDHLIYKSELLPNY